MALCFDMNKIKNRDEVTKVKLENGKEIVNPVTECLVFYLASVGISDVTEKNYREIFRRITLLDTAINGSFMKGEDMEPYYISVEEVEKHIGLTTNVSPMTKAQFNKHLIDILEREANSRMAKRVRKSN